MEISTDVVVTPDELATANRLFSVCVPVNQSPQAAVMELIGMMVGAIGGELSPDSKIIQQMTAKAPELIEIIHQVYVLEVIRVLPAEHIESIIEFMRSPAGVAWRGINSNVMESSMHAGMRWGQQFG